VNAPGPCLSEDEILAFLAEQVPAEGARAAARHLEVCRSCARLVSTARRLSLVFRGSPSGTAATPRAGALARSTVTAVTERAAPADVGVSHLARGTVVGRFVVLDVVGGGGMGIVYRAYDADLDRGVALKFVRPDLGGDAAAGEGGERLRREAQALARLAHPNVVAIHEVGTHEGATYLAMELVDGQTLTAWLEERPRSVAEVMSVFLQAGAGLTAAHDAGIVHRDFKPTNVLVGREGRVRVADFGLVARRGSEASRGSPPTPEEEARPGGDAAPVDGATPSTAPMETAAGALVGTPYYMAPEQSRGEAADARSDQYSFCVSLKFALEGVRRQPDRFDHDDQRAGGGSAGGRPAAASVPARLRRVIARGLAPRAADRYAGMGALLSDLERAARPRARGILVGVSVAASLVAVALALWVRAPASVDCTVVAGRLASVWHDARRARIGATLRATGVAGAEQAANRVLDRLDAYASRWGAERRAACAAAGGQGADAEVGRLRGECLDWRLEELRALGDLLEASDGGLAVAGPEMTDRLTPLATCAPERVMKRRRVAVVERSAPGPLAMRVAVLRARAAVHSMQLREAFDIAHAAAVEARAASQPALRSEALGVAAMARHQMGHPDEAAALFSDAVQLAVASGDHATAAATCGDLAWVTAFRGGQGREGLDRAERWAKLGAAFLDSIGGDDLLEARLLRTRAGLSHLRGRYQEALGHAERATAIVQELDPERLEVGVSLAQAGDALVDMGRGEAAAARFRSALVVFERRLGKEHPRSLHAMMGLAAALDRDANHEQALHHAAAALERSHAVFGRRDHPAAATALTVMARSLEGLGRLDDARARYDQALALMEPFGADDVRVAELRSARGSLRRRQGQLSQALADQRAATTVLERHMDAGHPVLADARHAQGETLLESGRPQEAAALFALALRARRADGVARRDLAATQFAMARCLWTLGRDRERARSLAREALSTLTPPTTAEAGLQASVRAWLAGRAAGQ
jgi:tetratricopeptide (TPR) repeat protein